MPTTPGKQAVIRYVQETVPGTTPANPAFLLFSRETLKVRVMVDVGQKESLDIGEIDVEEYYKTRNAYEVEVEAHIYDAARMMTAFLNRLSDGTPKPYSLEYIPDEDAATIHYWRMRGWRPSNVKIAAQLEEAYTMTIVFGGGIIDDPVTVDPGIGTGSREIKSAITEAIQVFAGGAITLNGAPWATLVGGIEVNVDNGVKASYTTGSYDPVVAATRYGVRKITGTGDISFDEGAATQWARVKAGAAHTIAIPFGTGSGRPLLSLTGAKFPKMEFESTTETEVLEGGQEFTAKSFTVGTVP